jgi:hypothetical protein
MPSTFFERTRERQSAKLIRRRARRSTHPLGHSMHSDSIDSFPSPTAFRVAHAQSWVAFVCHLFLTAIMTWSPARASFLLGLALFGVSAFSLAFRVTWSRWAVLATAALLIPIWIYSLSTIPYRGGARKSSTALWTQSDLGQ